MPAPTTFRDWRAAARAGQARGAAYRASPGYVARRTSAIFQRGLTQASASASPSYTSSTSSGCNNFLVSAGVSCAQQAGLRALGASPASALQQRQRLAAGSVVSRNSAASAASTGYYPSFPAPPPPASAFPTYATDGYNPNAGRFSPQVAGLGARLAAMRQQIQGYRAAGAARASAAYPPVYAQTLPGTYTEAGYQTTGPLPPATAQPSLSPLPEQQAPQPPAPVEQSQPSQDFTNLFQQSRTARGLMTVDLPGPIAPEALAYRLLSTNDPDARGGQVPYTLGHLFQTVSEQAVRLGNLPTAQVYASLASRYPVAPAYGDLGAFMLGGMSPARWLLTGALVFGAAMGLLAVRDTRRPARGGRRPRRNGRRRSRR
jgi:hypothetical protein